MTGPITADDSDREKFGYDYFDAPHGLGYRGYNHHNNGDGDYLPWTIARDFCLEHDVRTAIDLGCAKGFLVAELRAANIDAIGYDVSTYALSFAQGLPCYHHDIRQGIHRSADALFALGVLLYLDATELPAALGEIRAHTRRFFLLSSYYTGDKQEIPDPLRRITRPRLWWRRQVEDAGFYFNHEGSAFDVYTV